ncbi:hypothetical protein GCM10023238_14470 [Streptomyces heliomycini]
MILFRRPARRKGPEMPSGKLSLQEPPTLPEVVPDSSAVWTYLPMALMSVSMMLMFMRPGMSQGGGGFIYIALGVMVIASAGMMLGQVMRRNGERKQRMKGERRDYLRYLRQTRRMVRASIVEQQRALAWRPSGPRRAVVAGAQHPAVGTAVVGRGLRRGAMGVGDQRLAMKLTPLSTKPVEDLEPLSAHALRSFTRAYSTVPGPAHRDLSAGLVEGAVPRGRGANTRPGPGPARAVGGVPLPRRPVDRAVRLGRAARGVGVGEVAAAQPAPHERTAPDRPA